MPSVARTALARCCAQRLAQYAQSNREFRQGGGDADLCVTIGFRQFLNFPRKDVLTLFATSAEREQNVRVLPNLGSNWREVEVIEQTGYQARHNNEYIRVIKLPGKGDNMIGPCTRNHQGQVLALLKKVGLLLTQA